MTWPQHGHGCRWDSTPHLTDTRVYLLGIGHVRVHQHRPYRGHIKTVAVKREGKRWYVVLACDVTAKPLPATGAVVGVDMGIIHFLTTSDGEHVPNPRFMKAAIRALHEAQEALLEFPQIKAANGTRKHRLAAARVTRIYGKVRRQRLDHAHKVALNLVRGYDLIAHEGLNVQDMSRRPKPRPLEGGGYGPNGAAQKTGLNRAINDAGWGLFLRILVAKAESAGRLAIAVARQNTSVKCFACDHRAKGNRKRAKFRCLACGHEAHADVNAAENILRAGLALRAAQAA